MANPYLQSLQQSPLSQTPQTLFLLEGIQDPIVRQNFENLAKELTKRRQKLSVGKANIVFGPLVASTSVTDNDGLSSRKRPGGLSVEITTRGNPVRLALVAFPYQPSVTIPFFQVANGSNNSYAQATVGWERNGSTVASQAFGCAGNNFASIRGVCTWDGASLTKTSGSGFSVARAGVGNYSLTWDSTLSEVPGFVATIAAEIFHGRGTAISYSNLSTSGVTLTVYDPNAAALADGSFSFICQANTSGLLGGISTRASFPAFGFEDVVPSGTYTYQLYYSKVLSSIVSYANLRVVAYELP